MSLITKWRMLNLEADKPKVTYKDLDFLDNYVTDLVGSRGLYEGCKCVK